ncbi:1-acyl-sn-glycerol-3-phosphate acyltransferase [Flavobacterium agricola]|uniref:1-acyl-sn-glycerol-3-phosphate acyltransferase n=1 Tax=Flavobacterium agricola TaxID=2870839 RepID=A0ABY6LZY5_9FLAO|nr:1-acyl-sn-glycerol-3-phosphate acyltransferase [Flavobacterium agricola]UYW00984.1 1-acyl-sn-glycerol-3-phosphate acyltransferase [Flavobacterium agricola]
MNYLTTIQTQLNTEFANQAQVSLFGAALVADANAQQIKSDIFSTILVSMTTLMVLLVLFYRRISIPIIIFIPTIFAGAFALAILALLKTTISAISLSISAVLVGITIDYALHILTHFKRHNDPKELYKEITKPLIMSAATNAVAFLCLLFVHSEALIDLGVFASVAILSSAIFSLLIIPHIYKPKTENAKNSIVDKIAAYPFEKNKALIVTCLVVIFISLFTFTKVQYNNDLAGLNFMPNHLKTVENKLDALLHNQAKSVYVVSYGTNFDAVLTHQKQIDSVLQQAIAQQKIIQFTGLQPAVQSEKEQHQAFAKWANFWDKHKNNTKKILVTEGEKYGFSLDAHQSFYNKLDAGFSALQLADYNAIQALAVADFVTEKNGFITNATLVKLDEVHREAFITEIESLPEVLVIDRKQLNETYLGQLKTDFNHLIDYSILAVIAILWFFFKRLEWVLFSMLPIALTGLVTAGLMGAFGLELNIFSAIVCTLVFGHGVDFAIFMTSALQKEYTTGANELQTYRTSILLAVLTTVLAIGALIFAKHPALLSIASVSLLGVFAAVIITFVFYPMIFKIMVVNRVKKGLSPYTIRLFILSVLFFIFYGIISISVSVLGRLVFLVLPVSKQKKQGWFSWLMSKYMTLIINLNPFIKNKFYNPYGETFAKPAVIIANHASFLDTLLIGMRVPKIIFFVNDWVWNSPIFGRIVRAAGFYPVSKGIENGAELLKDKIAMGYSIVVFPEGTRSYDNSVKRFHKGAFYLADQLQLDIVPFYIHGHSEVMPKGDFIAYDGTLSTSVGKRILHADLAFGTTYSEKAKNIAAYFKVEFDALRLQLEDANYFKKKLLLSYLYKEEEVIQAVRSDFEQNKQNYHALNAFFGKKEKLMHWADDYGQLDCILALQQSTRKIYTHIADIEKRAVAQSNYILIHRNIQYVVTPVAGISKLLISKTIDVTTFEPTQLQGFTEIVLLYNPDFNSVLLHLGYKITYQTYNITHFVKN